MTAILDPILRRWPLAALAASAAMLAIAHGFETFGHLAPCTLCLKQREVYWAALVLAAIGVAAWITPLRGRADRLVSLLLAALFVLGCGVAVYHAGAEWKWWPGPSTCSGSSGGVSADALYSLMHGGTVHAPHCDQAAWVWLGLSMAGWNAVISAGLAALSLWAAARRPRR